MSQPRAHIEHALTQAKPHGEIAALRIISSSDAQRVVEVTLTDQRRLIAKLDANHERIRQEALGLRALAGSSTLLVPCAAGPHRHEDQSVLLMDRLETAEHHEVGEGCWAEFGRDLALHHQAAHANRYGWNHDNFCGPTPQSNNWCDDWARFNAEQRIGFQADRAARSGLLDAEQRRQIDALIARLPGLLPARPTPALLHGDLWSGNALPVRGEDGRVRIALIDPAVSVGDGWADIAMMRLFGGFPDACFEAYNRHAVSNDASGAEIERRVLVYQLYHLLNHVNIFGLAYVRQAMSVVRQLS